MSPFHISFDEMMTALYDGACLPHIAMTADFYDQPLSVNEEGEVTLVEELFGISFCEVGAETNRIKIDYYIQERL
jgi:hypothetical protein